MMQENGENKHVATSAKKMNALSTLGRHPEKLVPFIFFLLFLMVLI
ncbi:MAG: hypothetical protein IK042_05835 [Bacteroidales bacterium]|nr:hypothetical protein [Bacteroidales bacterium]